MSNFTYKTNKSYNQIISNLKDYMITAHLYNKYKLSYSTSKIETKEIKSKQSKENDDKKNNYLITINEIDQLFWYFFIAIYGYDEYKFLENKKFIKEKEIKIKNTEDIKKDTSVLKQNKIKICEFETDLINSKKISVITLKGLSAYNQLNILFVKNKSYYNFNFSDSKPYIIIYDDGKTYSCNINPDNLSIEFIKNTFYLIDNPNKPIKAISNYKQIDLQNIAIKLSINLKFDSGKSKNKNELYDEIKDNL